MTEREMHTPTNDEREALAHLFIQWQKRTGGLTNYSMMGSLADIALAAGFRRSEVQEPRAELVMQLRAWIDGEPFEVSQARTGQPVAKVPFAQQQGYLNGYAAAVDHVAAILAAVPEPQGEPSEHYDEGTLVKVYDAFRDNGYGTTEATDVVNAIQNAGILFRERGAEPNLCLTAHPITGARCSRPADPPHAHVCDLPPEPQGEPSSEVPEPRPCHLPQTASPCIGCKCGGSESCHCTERQVRYDNGEWSRTLEVDVSACPIHRAEPQGEPSDAQVLRNAVETALPLLGLFSPWNTSPEQIENVRGILARALRAAAQAGGEGR